MVLLIMLSLSPHVRSSPPTNQEVGFPNTNMRSSPLFYVDPIEIGFLGSLFPVSHYAHSPTGLATVVGGCIDIFKKKKIICCIYTLQIWTKIIKI